VVVVYLSSHRSAAPSQRSKDFGGNAAPPDPYGQGGFGAGRFNGGGFADQDEVACSSLSFLLLSYLFLLSKGTRDLVKFRVVASFLSSTCFLSTLRVLSSPVMLILIVFQPSHVLIIACLFVCKKKSAPFSGASARPGEKAALDGCRPPPSSCCVRTFVVSSPRTTGAGASPTGALFFQYKEINSETFVLFVLYRALTAISAVMPVFSTLSTNFHLTVSSSFILYPWVSLSPISFFIPAYGNGRYGHHSLKVHAFRDFSREADIAAAQARRKLGLPDQPPPLARGHSHPGAATGAKGKGAKNTASDDAAGKSSVSRSRSSDRASQGASHLHGSTGSSSGDSGGGSAAGSQSSSKANSSSSSTAAEKDASSASAPHNAASNVLEVREKR